MCLFSSLFHLLFLFSCFIVSVQARGVRFPIRATGGIGKLTQRFIQKNSRKEAEKAAQHQGGGGPPIHHK
jgi:hypothetical protein